MMLETAATGIQPIFLTLTYATEVEVDRLVKNLQLFIRAIRRRGIAVRYFLTTERGSLNGRLHHHGVLWSKVLNSHSSLKRKEIPDSCWRHGFVQCSMVRKPTAMKYVAKYVQKQGEERLPYTWSRKPVIGRAGVDAWRVVVEQMCKREAYPNRS